MRMDVTKTTVERAIVLGERLNHQKAVSIAIEMTGDRVMLRDVSGKCLSDL